LQPTLASGDSNNDLRDASVPSPDNNAGAVLDLFDYKLAVEMVVALANSMTKFDRVASA
jgi:hypothetical protein